MDIRPNKLLNPEWDIVLQEIKAAIESRVSAALSSGKNFFFYRIAIHDLYPPFPLRSEKRRVLDQMLAAGLLTFNMHGYTYLSGPSIICGVYVAPDPRTSCFYEIIKSAK